MTTSTKSDQTFTPIAAVLAWLWPGLGHIMLGERRRGVMVMIGMLFLIIAGVLIGGVDVVDQRKDRLWFLAQAGCGPLVFGIDYAQSRLVRTEEQHIHRRAVGRVNEIGTLYIGLAGLMNLVVILDALHHPPPQAVERRGKGKKR